MEVSVVIPVYNSASILKELSKQVNAELLHIDFELILVNDGSVDESWSVIEQIAKEFSTVKGISLAKNFGQDNAIMAGLGLSCGNYVVIMDDDLQHSPSDIPILLEKIKNDCDVCYADFSDDLHQAWWKNIGSMLNSKQAEFFIKKPKHIYLSPFKVVNRMVVDSLLEYKGTYPYIDGLIFQTTNLVSQVQVKHFNRYSDTGNYNLRRSISVFIKHTTGFSIMSLRIASFFGLSLSILGFMLGVYYIYTYYMYGTTVEGWTSIIVLQLFIGGAILSSLGIIGEYIGRSYLSINRKPQFIVRKTIND
jgi:undecaprenyl-phosphate 4-deoxy-4-formamido-L-arabinose transferase